VPAPDRTPGVTGAPTRRPGEPGGGRRAAGRRAVDHHEDGETGGGTPIDALLDVVGTFDRGSGDVPRTGRCDPPPGRRCGGDENDVFDTESTEATPWPFPS